MKKLSILILLTVMISSLSIAQNYQMINTEGVMYFGNSYPKAYEIISSENTDEGTLHYPYKSALRINGDGYIVNPNTSFIGDSIFIDQTGNTTFYCSHGAVLFFKPYIDFTPWVVYSETNGAKIEANYTNMEHADILPELSDNIATMLLQVYDSLGNLMTDHDLHNIEMKVSENYGAINIISVGRFIDIYFNGNYDRDLAFNTLSGIKLNETEYGKVLEFETLVKSLEIGTIHHKTFGDYSDYYEIKRELIEKSDNDPYITYTYNDCIHEYSWDSDTIYNEQFTLILNYRIKPNEILDSLEPGEESGFLYIVQYGEGIQETFNKPYLLYKKYHKHYDFDFFGVNYWKIRADFEYSMGLSASHRFIEGIGDFIPYRGESSTDEELVYYKTATEEWGTPLEFECVDASGITENTPSQISIFPNPANNILHIKSETEIDKALVFDLQGRIMKKFDLQSSNTLDISSLRNGVYFIEIESQGVLLKRQKLIIQ